MNVLWRLWCGAKRWLKKLGAHTSCNMQEFDKVRAIYERFVLTHGDVKHWLKCVLFTIMFWLPISDSVGVFFHESLPIASIAMFT